MATTDQAGATTDQAGQAVAFDATGLKRQFPALRDPALHYLDNAATAQMPECVLARLNRFETGERANVHGGVHRLARAASEAYEGARATVARYLNAAGPEEVVFTYGATSSINLLAHSFGETLGEGDEVVISVLEHHSNLLPWQKLARQRGVVLRVLPKTEDGRIDLTRLESLVTERCRLIALTHCSNVTGALTEVPPVVEAARAVGARVMLDGAQRMPHGPVDLQALGVDFYVFSGHKTFGPTGIGVLWGRRECLEDLPPFMVGGQMVRRVSLAESSFADPPKRFEAGTPPIAGAVGLGAAISWMAEQDWPAITEDDLRLTRRVIEGLSAVRGARILGPSDLHLRRGVVSFVIEGLETSALCRVLDEHGVAARCGHHCAQPLMADYGAEGAARVSLAPYNDDADVDAFLEGLDAAVRRLK